MESQGADTSNLKVEIEKTTTLYHPMGYPSRSSRTTRMGVGTYWVSEEH